jgi:hypothetical protein
MPGPLDDHRFRMLITAQSCMVIGNIEPYRTHQFPGIGEFLTALQAYLVRSFLDCDYAAPFFVVTPEGKLDNQMQ